MITEDYVSFETAKLLKEKGFDCGCACINHPQCGMSLIGHMINNTDLQLTREFELCIDKENLFTIPTIQMAMRWLREIHNLQIQIAPITSKHNDWTFGIDRNFSPLTIDLLCFPTYEEACEAAIKYCLENLI